MTTRDRYGTSGADILMDINGRDGNDMIYELSGDDWLAGKGVYDQLYGGHSNRKNDC